MKRFTYYLLSLALSSSFHLVGMDITDISSAEESDDETSESTQRVRKNTLYKMDIRFLTEPKPMTFKDILKTKLLERMNRKISPKALSASKKTHTAVIEDLLIPIQMVDVEHNLSIFKSENGSGYHIVCDRCSTDKPFFLSGNTFTIAYGNLRSHLRRTHQLPEEQVLIEVPRRKISQRFRG